jgi:hypothetical protein
VVNEFVMRNFEMHLVKRRALLFRQVFVGVLVDSEIISDVAVQTEGEEA